MFALFASSWDFSYSFFIGALPPSLQCRCAPWCHTNMQTILGSAHKLLLHSTTSGQKCLQSTLVHFHKITVIRTLVKSHSDSPSLVSKDKLQHVVCSFMLHGDWLSDDYIQKHGLRAEGRKDQDQPCADKLFKNPAHDIELIYKG